MLVIASNPVSVKTIFVVESDGGVGDWIGERDGAGEGLAVVG